MNKRHIIKIMDRLNDVQCRIYWCNHVGSLNKLSDSDREIFKQLSDIYQKMEKQLKTMPDTPIATRNLMRELYDCSMGYPPALSFRQFCTITITVIIITATSAWFVLNMLI